MTALRPQVALYQVCGTALPSSPLILLTDDLAFYGVDAPETEAEPAPQWFVLRLMVGPEGSEEELATSLLGWGVGPVDALLNAGLTLGWVSQQHNVPNTPLVESMLLAYTGLSVSEDASREAHIHHLLGRIEDLIEAVVDLGVEPQALLDGLSVLLRGTESPAGGPGLHLIAPAAHADAEE